jgi:hypothetical protein
MSRRGRGLAPCLGLALLVLAACGRKGPPVAPELRAPQRVLDLDAVVRDAAIELSWTPPHRRVDRTPIRDLAPTTRIFRVEDGGAGEPKTAILARGVIAGYTEIASLRGNDPTPAVARGSQLVFTDRQALEFRRRYTYVVVVGDSEGRLGPPSVRASVTYVPAAAPPAELVAEAGDREVRLTWLPPTRLIDGSAPTVLFTYEVLRAPSADAELKPVTPVPIGELVLIDRGLENDHTYSYAVRAVQVASNSVIYSAASPRVAATPRDVTPPAPPASLVAIPSTATVRLAWSASPERDVAVYIVYRAAAGGAFERVGSTRAPTVTFIDRNVPSGTYRYVVTAEDAGARPNESGRSNEVTVTVP